VAPGVGIGSSGLDRTVNRETLVKAIVQTGYGSPDGFELTEIATPKIKKDDQILIRVHAAALYVGDVFMMRGVPTSRGWSLALRSPHLTRRLLPKRPPRRCAIW